MDRFRYLSPKDSTVDNSHSVILQSNTQSEYPTLLSRWRSFRKPRASYFYDLFSIYDLWCAEVLNRGRVVSTCTCVVASDSPQSSFSKSWNKILIPAFAFLSTSSHQIIFCIFTFIILRLWILFHYWRAVKRSSSIIVGDFFHPTLHSITTWCFLRQGIHSLLTRSKVAYLSIKV